MVDCAPFARPVTVKPLNKPNTFRAGPDEHGRFGIFGGRFVAETLMPLILAVEQAYNEAKDDPKFAEQMEYYRKHYIGRPSPLYLAERLTQELGGAKFEIVLPPGL